MLLWVRNSNREDRRPRRVCGVREKPVPPVGQHGTSETVISLRGNKTTAAKCVAVSLSAIRNLQ